MGGAPLATTVSRRPQRESWTTPARTRECVEVVSLGKAARSSSTTSWPARASSIAVAAPAHRAPTTTTSAVVERGIGTPSTGGRPDARWAGTPGASAEPPSFGPDLPRSRPGAREDRREPEHGDRAEQGTDPEQRYGGRPACRLLHQRHALDRHDREQEADRGLEGEGGARPL